MLGIDDLANDGIVEFGEPQTKENGSTDDDPRNMHTSLSSNLRHQNDFDSVESLLIGGRTEVQKGENENLEEENRTGGPDTAAINDNMASQSCKSLQQGREDYNQSIGVVGGTAEEDEAEDCEEKNEANEGKPMKHSETNDQVIPRSGRKPDSLNRKSENKGKSKKMVGIAGNEDNSDSSVEIMVVDPHLIDPVDKMKEFSKYSKCWV